MNLENDIRQVVFDTGVSGKPICIHSSLKSFGWVDGGPGSIIDAFLQENCTIVVPAFVSTFWAPPDLAKRIPRNAYNYDAVFNKWKSKHIYSQASNDIDEVFIGAIPAALLKMKDRSRGMHPINSFAAVGPFAQTIIAQQTPTDVYGHFRSMVDLDGYIILMGVDLNRMTFIHYAEQLSGRKLFIRWANTECKMGDEVCVGGCSEGFTNLAPVLELFCMRFNVGLSGWMIFSMKDILPILIDAIRNNPQITHCLDPDCIRCNDLIAGGPIY